MDEGDARLDRRSVLRGIAGAGAVAAGASTVETVAADECTSGRPEFASTREGRSDRAREFEYDPRSDHVCGIRAVLSPTGSFLNLAVLRTYLTTDGREPTPDDHDETGFAFLGGSRTVLDDPDPDSSVRVLVVPVFGTTDYDLTFSEYTAHDGTCNEIESWSHEGTIASGGSETFEHRISATDPCEASVWLDGHPDADMDLYVTLDGRTPTEDDYDVRSSGDSAVEMIYLDSEFVEKGQTLGILVSSYDGGGEYLVGVT